MDLLSNENMFMGEGCFRGFLSNYKNSEITSEKILDLLEKKKGKSEST